MFCSFAQLWHDIVWTGSRRGCGVRPHSTREDLVADFDWAPARRGRRTALAVAATIAAGAPAMADESDASVLMSFVAGDYALVGRGPDGGASYAGTAKIAEEGDHLSLERQVGGRTVRATGRVEVPSPPGEGQVLRFRWTDGQAITMTCLVAGDLDNYARLTCLWGTDGKDLKEPGLEAMFSMTAWPEGAGSPD
jgi:hypothetical protein